MQCMRKLAATWAGRLPITGARHMDARGGGAMPLLTSLSRGSCGPVAAPPAAADHPRGQWVDGRRRECVVPRHSRVYWVVPPAWSRPRGAGVVPITYGAAATLPPACGTLLPSAAPAVSRGAMSLGCIVWEEGPADGRGRAPATAGCGCIVGPSQRGVVAARCADGVRSGRGRGRVYSTVCARPSRPVLGTCVCAARAHYIRPLNERCVAGARRGWCALTAAAHGLL